MIDVSEMIHDPDFEGNITIERTTGGHYEGPQYVADTKAITVKGILVNPKNSKESMQTPQGDRAEGFVDIYVDKDTPIFVTRENSDGDENNISDVVVVDSGTDFETRYRITNVFDRSQWGFFKAEGQKVGASG